MSLAIGNAHDMAIDLLLTRGANASDVSGYFLYKAACRDDKRLFHSLLDKGANVNQKNGCGNTALFWAAGDGHTENRTVVTKQRCQCE